MAADDPFKDLQPTSAAGKKELNRMRKLHNLADDMSGANKALVALVLASLGWAGFKVGDSSSRIPTWLVVAGFLAAAIAAIAVYLLKTQTYARALDADNSATKRGQDYPVLVLLFVLELSMIPLAAGLQGYSVYRAVTAAPGDVDNELAMRVDLYTSDSSQLLAVRSYCTKHRDDAGISKRFLVACASFVEPKQPTADDARKVVASLRN